MKLKSLSSRSRVVVLLLLMGSMAAVTVGAGSKPVSRKPLSTSAAVNPGSISVHGQAQVLVVPDQVEIRLGIVSHDPELGLAKADNDRRTAASLARLKGMGLAARDYQTDAIHVEPEYETIAGQPQVLKRFAVQRHVVITLREVGRFEELLQALLDAGVNQVLDIQFCSTELRRHRDEARRMAIRAAQEKAELLVGELGGHLGRPTRIDEQGNQGGWSSYGYYSLYGGSWHSRSSSYMMQNSVAVASGPSEASAEGSTQAFAPGQIRVSAVVLVQFEME